MFQSFYLSIPKNIRPSEKVSMLYYVVAHHHPDLTLFLREKISLSLQRMFINAEEIEKNLYAFGSIHYQILIEDLDAGELEEYEHCSSYLGLHSFSYADTSFSDFIFPKDLTIGNPSTFRAKC